MANKMWNKKYQNDYWYYYDIDSFIEAIKRGEINYDFSVKSKYTCGEEVTNPYEQQALIKNNDIVYTNNEHPVCLGFFETYIDKNFLKKHKEIIVNTIKKQILNDNSHTFILINNYIFSNDFLKQLIKYYKGQHYIFKETNLTDNQITLLKENHIHAEEIKNGKKTIISTNIAYDSYTFDDIKKQSKLTIDSDINDSEIQNFKGINNLIITIEKNGELEDEYYNKIKTLLIKFDKLDTNISIRVECEKRSLFNKFINNLKLNNVKLLICNDNYDYTYKDYTNEESLLNSMVYNINNSNCTPFEKYICVYNIVKNYKPFKEVKEKDNYELSRNLRYILKNDYMVCVGYTKLFRELLDKVGIESTIYFTSVDKSYDEGFTLEEKPLDLEGHARILVNLVDKKYNINGFYISDPTWDNNMEKDLYGNMIMPFDYMQKSESLFKLQDIDYILDVHNQKELNTKIKILLHKKYEERRKNKSKYINNPKQRYENDILDTYYEIISLITETIKKLDYNKYKEINEIWKSLLNYEEPFETIMNKFNYFINYISTYIINKSNKELTKKTIIEGIIEANKKTGKILNQDIEEYMKELNVNYDYQESIIRPYVFPDYYLSEKDDGIEIQKKIL